MKIAYVHSGLWPSPSPSMTFATGNATGLAAAADEAHFLIRRNSPDTPDDIFRGVFGWERPVNLHIHQGPGVWRGINTRWFYYRWAYRLLVRLLKQGRIDAVITRAVPFLPYLVRLKRKYGVPVLYESHDFFADLSLRPGGSGKTKRRNSRLERAYLPAVSGIICLQNSQKQLYRTSFPDVPVLVARTGIKVLLPDAGSARPALGYVGSLDPHKGVDLLLDAAARSTVRPPVVIAGGKDRHETDRCRARAAERYPGGEVTVTGWIGKRELAEQLQQMRAGVVPLKDTFFNRHLTSPLKLFDYYAAGVPVLCADLPTTRELADEGSTGFFYRPGDTDALARAIDAVFMLNDDRYAAMRAAVRQRAAEYLWTERAARQLAWIRTLGNGGEDV